MTSTLEQAGRPDLSDAYLTVALMVRERSLSSPDGVAMRDKRFGIWQERTWAELWEEIVAKEIAADSHTSSDPRLRDWSSCGRSWTVANALRTDIERRQALVEIDVLSAMEVGFELEELLTAYRVQFPVLQQYERERLYDQRGRIVPTSKTAAGNPAVSAEARSAVVFYLWAYTFTTIGAFGVIAWIGQREDRDPQEVVTEPSAREQKRGG